MAAETLLNEFQVFYLNDEAINELESLRKTIKTKKRYADVIIAAMARAGNLIVVTRNVKDFKDLLPTMKIQNWIDQSYSN